MYNQCIQIYFFNEYKVIDLTDFYIHEIGTAR